jgi:hypothetical protein
MGALEINDGLEIVALHHVFHGRGAQLGGTVQTSWVNDMEIMENIASACDPESQDAEQNKRGEEDLLQAMLVPIVRVWAVFNLLIISSITPVNLKNQPLPGPCRGHLGPLCRERN